MIEPNQLLQTYIRQYQAASKKKRKTSSRPRDLNERTNRLLKTLKRTKPTQVTSLSLEEWHRQIKNLAYFAYRSHNDAVTKLIETSLLPQLIRLDEAMFPRKAAEEASAGMCVSAYGSVSEMENHTGRDGELKCPGSQLFWMVSPERTEFVRILCT